MKNDVPNIASEQGAAAPSPTAGSIEAWLVRELADALGLDAGHVDATQSFHGYGLESVQSIALMAKLSEHVGAPVSPVLVWRHGTIRALAEHLAGGGGADAPTARGPGHASRHDEPIAVVGIACRFPGGADDPEKFWKLLCDGVDAIRDVPEGRWDAEAYYDPDSSVPGKMNVKQGGFLERVDGFDPLFFGISPREAEQMDPQQRLLLELAWEALEDGGIVPGSLRESDTGVFVGSVFNDYDMLASALGKGALGPYSSTGSVQAILANRVSYALGLQGPSLAVNTACSSSLVSVHLACQSLRAGECGLALAGGVNLMLAPETTLAISKFGALSPDARCRTFDADAQGYVRGEGGGLVVLKPLWRALRDGDRVYAVIRASAVNNDGPSNGLTAPSPRAQEDVIRRACEAAGIAPSTVDYVELHGTGTSLGDPIEASALGAVFRAGRRDGERLLVGSAKTNIGHLEAAAGVVGLIKASLALSHRRLPPSLHFARPNPHIDLDALGIEVVTSLRDWPEREGQLPRAGVSSFGLGGTNAHVVLEAAGERLLSMTETVIHGDRAPSAEVSLAPIESARRVAFVFSGLGPQWLGMGRRLCAREPAFQAALRECDRALSALAGWSLLDELFAPDETSLVEDSDRHDVLNPLLVAVQIAAAALFRSWGVTPRAVVGHSIGEIAAAEAAGIINRREAMEIVARVGAVYRRTVEAGGGVMAFVALSPAQLRLALRLHEGRIFVTADNDPRSCVLCGPPGELLPLLDRLTGQGVLCRVMSHVRAHCPLARPFSEVLATELAHVAPRRARVPMFSTTLGRYVNGSELDARYWQQNLESPVRFRAAIEELAGDGCSTFVEMSPHPILAKAIQKTLHAHGAPCEVLAAERRDEDDAALSALARLRERTEPEALGTSVLVPLSARSDEALLQRARDLRSALGTGTLALADLAFTAALHREHHARRLCLAARSADELADKLDAFVDGELVGGASAGHAAPNRRPRVAFVFPGQGSQWLGMGRELLASEPVFRDALEACDRAVVARAGWSVLDELHASTASSRLEEVDVIQPMIFALQVAFAALLRSWGVEPDVVVGHSMGEVAAAHVAGALDLDDAARIICARSAIARRRASGKGGMAAVELSREEAEALLEGRREQLSVAVSNGPRSTVLSGDNDALAAVLDELRARGVWVKPVKVDYASHSPHMDALRDELAAALEPIRPRDGGVDLFSTVTVARTPGASLDAGYWVRNLREPVRFAEVIHALAAEGVDAFIEISPHPVLVPSIQQNLEHAGARALAVGSGRREGGERFALLASLGALWTRGADVDWHALFPDGGRRITLPAYPWQRERYWLDAPDQASPRAKAETPNEPPSLAGKRLRSPLPLFEAHWSPSVLPGISATPGRARLAPAACLLAFALGAAHAIGDGCSLAELRFERPLALPAEGERVVQLAFDAEDRFAVHALEASTESWSRHAAGRVDRSVQDEPPHTSRAALRGRLSHAFAGAELDALLPGGDRFTKKAWRAPGEVLLEGSVPAGRSDVETFSSLVTEALRVLFVSASLDPDEHTFATAHRAAMAPLGRAAWVHARLTDGRIDLWIRDEEGEVAGRLEGATLSRIDRGALATAEILHGMDWRYELRWQPLDKGPRAAGAGGAWLLFCDEGGIGNTVAAALRARGERCVLVAPQGAATAHQLPWSKEAVESAVREATGDGQTLTGVVHLWALDEENEVSRFGEPACASVLHLVQAVAGLSSPPKLWLFTRGAWPVLQGDKTLSPGQGALWGLGRTIGNEHPELGCKLVDLDATRGVDASAADVLAALAIGGDEDQLATRGGRFHALRLERAPRALERIPELRANASYVVTGGLGALGMITAEWLVERGARHIALTGRSAPSASAAEAIRRLEEKGARVLVVRADISRRDEVARVLEEIGREMPPLKGVVHCAGILDDGILLQQRWDRFEKVFAPKAWGAWHLHELTLALPLDLFLMFSSLSAIFGFGGLGNYAAANAYLDALAWHRRTLGLAVTSVNWGEWTGSGMAVAVRARAGSLDVRGLRGFSAVQGKALLSSLLAEPQTHVSAHMIDWAELDRQRRMIGNRSPLLALLAPPPASQPRQTGTVIQRILEAAEGERLRVLEDHVRARVAKILGLRSSHPLDPTQGLFDLGLGSLMSAQLRGQLAIDFEQPMPAMLAFDRPTVRALAEYLRESVPALTAAARREVPESEPPAISVTRPLPSILLGTTDIDALSEDEAEGSFWPSSRALQGSTSPAGRNEVGMTPPNEKQEAESPFKQALRAVQQMHEMTARLEEMKARLDKAESNQREPIAVIGMGCRGPGGISDPESFWRLLREGVDATREVPADRWDVDTAYDADRAAPGKTYVRRGGFLDDVAGFDAGFFRISPREAQKLDPQQRLLLEVVWEAVEHAGLPPSSLAGSRTGVFMASAPNQYLQRSGDAELAEADAYALTGNLQCTLSGRISYVLGLRGPNLQLDTGCSASLVALHLACQSLRARESHAALAGGVNLILSPHITVASCKASALAPDGRCKTFDARADGYARGEGCGVVVLKRLSDALAAGDRVLGVIRGTAVNHDGFSSGLTVPSGAAQEELIRTALADAGVDAREIGFVETHGTGTQLGDPIELGALARVYGEAPGRDSECVLGALKTNIAHLELAAGIMGLIKALLCLEHGEIPRIVHFEQENPKLAIDETPFVLPTCVRPWPPGPPRRLAGVSSFGIGGTNAHVIVEQAPALARLEMGTKIQEDRPALLVLSARSPGALRDLTRRYRDLLASPGAPDLHDVAAAAALRRDHFEHRLGVAAQRREDAVDLLSACAGGEPRKGIVTAQAVAGRAPRVVFVFAGQGSHRFGMGRSLYEGDPAFRTTFDRCDEAISAAGGSSPRRELFAAPESSRIEEAEVLQPLLFAIQVALAGVWRSLGIEPEAVVGHSLGEIAAAHVAGALTLADAAAIVCTRSRAIQRSAGGPGGMALVELPAVAAREVIAPWGDRLCVAIENSPASVVIAGEVAAVDELLVELAGRDVWSKRVKVDFAFHSPLMDPAKAALRDALVGLAPRAETLPFISTVTARREPGSSLDADYWVRNLREPVQFAAAIQALATDGYDTFLEIGPHPVLLPAVQDNLAHVQREGVAIASLRRDEDERTSLAVALGALYVRGAPIDFRRVYPGPVPIASLPTYPWQRQRFWIDYRSPLDAGAQGRDSRDSRALDEDAGRDTAPRVSLRDLVLSAPREERATRMTAHVRARIGESLRLAPTEIAPSAPFPMLGLDSMMGIELTRRLGADLGLLLSSAMIWRHPTAEALAQHLARLLEPAGDEGARAFEAPASGLVAASSPWVVTPRPRPEARLRLFCFPYSAGGAAMFRSFSEALPRAVELCAICPPGRESRSDEPPYVDLPRLVTDLLPALEPLLDRPFALLGYSLGALTAFETARQLRREGAHAPEALFVASCPAPHCLLEVSDEALSKEALTAFLRDGGAVPEAIWSDPELVELVLRAMRADATQYKTYCPEAEAPLDCPITVYASERDPQTPWESALEWAAHTTERLALRPMPGEHFFVRSHPESFLGALRRDLGQLLDGLPAVEPRAAE